MTLYRAPGHDDPGPFYCYRLIVTHDAEDVQQAGEDIEDVDEERNCRTDIVGFATVDDTAGIKQDETTHQQDHTCRNRKAQCQDAEEALPSKRYRRRKQHQW